MIQGTKQELLAKYNYAGKVKQRVIRAILNTHKLSSFRPSLMRIRETLPHHFYYNGRHLGVLKEDFNFIMFRKREHFFKKYGGWALNTYVLEKLRKLQCKEIMLVFEDEQKEQRIYKTTLTQYYTNGIRYKNKKERQIILEHKHFISI